MQGEGYSVVNSFLQLPRNFLIVVGLAGLRSEEREVKKPEARSLESEAKA